LIVEGHGGGRRIWEIGGKVVGLKIKQRAADSMRGGAVQLGEGRGHRTCELDPEQEEREEWK
jgi:hypothetical protein